FTESKKKGLTTYTFTVNNLPASRSYEDAPDNSYYATQVIFYIDQVEENGTWKNFLSTVGDLYRYNYEFIRKTNESVSDELKQLTDSLVRGASTEREKARRIYRWVQTHIKYVAFEEGMEGFVPREASLVCSRRFGDCKDMASILTAMLRHAGLNAYFTWIGSRNLPYRYTETPLPIVDNHMICTVKLGEEYVFLDGTDESCLFGMPASGIQGKEALLAISEKEYKLLEVPVPKKEVNRYTDSTFLRFTDKGLAGTLRVCLTGYHASRLQSALNYRNEKEREEYLKRRFWRGTNKATYSDWKVTPSATGDEVVVTADLELPDYGKKLGEEWILNLNLFKLYEHQEIDFPKRKSPIEHPFLEASSFVTVLQVPAGFKVSYLPKSQQFQNNVWGFNLAYQNSSDRILLTQEFSTNTLLMQPDQFEAWNKVLENLFPHYKQSIVLSKN
ncbi:MAG TPA: transglutaminase-like domain-containing protein, partial [Chitinophagaceae bacterium]|nr:transglutaminase-like domain-containing protein [Chitinophagaceae bacterium]